MGSRCRGRAARALGLGSLAEGRMHEQVGPADKICRGVCSSVVGEVCRGGRAQMISEMKEGGHGAQGGWVVILGGGVLKAHCVMGLRGGSWMWCVEDGWCSAWGEDRMGGHTGCC